MRSKPPVTRAAREAADLAFDPVPRTRPRHDGWTPERQKAFIEALADTGCVQIACRMVNMSQPSAYMLRRQPGAESFRRAWDAAQSLGLQAVKDEAFHRAMHGQLVPVFVAGRLMGFRRKKNDRLLMFILRHYGQDAQGRKTTINYFSTRATAGAAANPPRDGEGDRPQVGGGGPGTPAAPAALAAAESATTTVKTVITGAGAGQSGPLAAETEAAGILQRFEGVELDAQAQAEIYRALEAAAERRRALEVGWETPAFEAFERQAADPECDFVPVAPGDIEYAGELESGGESDWVEYRPEGEHRWESLGEGGAAAEADRLLAEMAERRAAMTPEQIALERAEVDAAIERARAAERRRRALPPPREPDPDDPALDWRNWAEDDAALSEEDEAAAVHAGAGEPVPSEAERPLSPRTGRPLRRYRKRTPKPPFTPPDAAREAQARKEVEKDRAEKRKPVDRRRREHRARR